MSEQQPDRWVNFGHIDGTAFSRQPAEVGDARFTALPEEGYEIITDEFVIDDEQLADLYAANPSLGRAANVVHVSKQFREAASSTLNRMLVEGVQPRGRGASRDRVILDELRQFRAAAADLNLKLLDWQEKIVRQWFEVDDNLQMLGVHGTNFYFGPVGSPPILYDECTTSFLDSSVWDSVRPTPRNDGEMLNRVIDDIATDCTAKIAAIECPRFPRADA